MKREWFFPKQGMYDPNSEHDSCGVGFVVNMKGVKTHKLIMDGIQILENLTHRGAAGSDPLTGDGAGILIQMPDKFFRKVCPEAGIELPEAGRYGAGKVFLPVDKAEREKCEKWFAEIIESEGLKLLGFRDVPHDSTQIGEVAHSEEPEIKQVFIGAPKDMDDSRFAIKLFVVRKMIENTVAKSDISEKRHFYICSLNTTTFIYKGQLLAEQVKPFYTDLFDEDMVSAMALVHSRYSTNTFPSWPLAHPFRVLAHNGEINTLRGNVNWMKAREKQFVSDAFGEDIKKIMPIIAEGGSDSAGFDNALEMMVMAGRPLPQAVMMMIPEAWNGHESMEQEKKDFYQYHACMMEPWDGPASVAFSDGRYMGAVLDRNGLRPSRFTVTKDGLVIMASETGALPVDPANVVQRGRLQPGKMFLVDTHEGRIIEDKEIKHKYASENPYGKWLKDELLAIEDLNEEADLQAEPKETYLERQQAFGYTREDVRFLIKPMAEGGKEPIGSMGDDTPLAVLSNESKLMFNYFKQLFAQVTNPPIDPIREKIVMDMQVFLGAEGNLLQPGASHCHRLRISRPVITDSELAKIRAVDSGNLKATTVKALFPKSSGKEGLDAAFDKLCAEVDKAVEDGYTMIIISDKGIDENNVAMPSLIACGGVHQHLIRKGTRTKVSLISETGEAREMHHFAVLIGYGVNAINPYLAFETIKNECEKGGINVSYEEGVKNYVKSTRDGLFKIISKMGISTIQSYCGAQIFEAIGLHKSVIDKYFTATTSRIGGIGILEVAEETLRKHDIAYPENINEKASILKAGGYYHWRKQGEQHQYNPESLSLVQQAVRTGNYKLYKKYSESVTDYETNSPNIRALLKFKEGNAIPIEEVEPAENIVKRFATGAMSYGSISSEAHETLAIAMNRLGGFSNSGEGGEKRSRYLTTEPNGDSKRSRIKQVAQGRFGVTIEYLVNGDQLQIKMAQGAKPGEGGHLPGHKVTAQIANTRHTTPGVGLISPPPHHDIYSIEDLSQLIYDLKNANENADVSVKLVSEIGVGTVAAGVSKGKADHLLISGGDGGTGASPLSSLKHAGLPVEVGIAETQQVLVANDLRGRIRVQVDGQLKTGRDVAVMAMLGADEMGFATAALVTMGCCLERKCHLNACSVGIATQDPELRKKFAGKPEHVMNFFMFVAEECREIMASVGVKKFEDMIGRVDLLETKGAIDHWKAKGIDLSNVLYNPEAPETVARCHKENQDHGLENVLDRELLEKCQEAIKVGEPVELNMDIKNTDRTVGAILSSKIALAHGLEGLNEDTIKVNFTGSAGQTFGGFLSHGVTFKVEGDANDFVGKGLSGGKIIVVPSKESTFIPEDNIIVGNVLFYGAIKGEGYIRGVAGERFCVRNSGVTAVVEGVGDHACEYMTGGRAVILGETGRNFAAGMSGGIAYVWDRNKDFKTKCNMEMVELFDVVDDKDKEELKEIISNHLKYTGSTVAEHVLSHFDDIVKEFVKVFPTDYRRVLESLADTED